MRDHYDETEFTHHGHKFLARFYVDDSMGAPWDEHDGHGPVREQKSTAKRPGERPMGRYFYDWQAAIAMAKADGWGLSDKAKLDLIDRLGVTRTKRLAIKSVYNVENGMRQDRITQWEETVIPGVDMAQRLVDGRPLLTKGEITAEAVRLDYEHMLGWINDRWHWCGISVVPMIPSYDRLKEAVAAAIDVEIDDDARDTLDAVLGDLQTALDADDEYAPEAYANALWGIESDSAEYHQEVMRELADQYLATLES